jgi:hypothetical protein
MKQKRAQFLKADDVVHVAESAYKVLDLHLFKGDGSVAIVAEWVDGVPPTHNQHIFFEFDDEVTVEGEWTREELDEVINRRFPNRLDTFYSDSNYVAVVEDHDGDIWRVFADDDCERYKR